jgi:transmembrane sensor
MSDNRLQDLFRKYYNKTATAVEREALRQLLAEVTEDDRLTPLLREAWEGLQEEQPFFPAEQRAAMLSAILDKGIPAIPTAHPHAHWWRMAAAAVLLLGCLAGGYQWFARSGKTNKPSSPVAVVAGKDIPPGGNKAILVLADGSSIALDSAGDGQLSTQAGTRVLKQQDGQLAYRQAAGGSGSTSGSGSTGSFGPSGISGTAQAPVYNTVATPRGGQYKILLPDGTRVWLNAASSLRFPTAFPGGERTVSITGEAYFEVASDKSKPFRVRAGRTTVEVLGTHFNIMAYDDEKILATTLLEGAVRVADGTNRALLSPGEQAGVNKATGILGVARADTSEVIAWKNEQFTFNDLSIQSIMRQLSRWYDIDVQFGGSIAPREIRGSISRNYNISEVLDMLAFTAGIRYTIEGKKVIINQN